MEKSTKRRILIWSIIVLVIINVASLGTIWFHKFGPRHKGRQVERVDRHRSSSRDFSKTDRIRKLHQALKLDNSQSEKFDSIFESHAEARRSNLKKMGELKKLLNDELRQGELNQDTIDLLLLQQVDLFKEGNNQIVEMNLALRELLSNEQREKLSKYMDNARSRRGPKEKF